MRSNITGALGTITALLMAWNLSVMAASEDVAATFRYTNPTAKKVELAGEFNNWRAVPMTKDAAGVWSTTLHLKPGHYGYKFIVNGTDWIFDPDNPARKTVNDIENSAIAVGGGAPTTPAAPAGTVPVTFRYSDPAAGAVVVAGEFNQWNVGANPMSKDAAGNWTATVPLKPGRYQYKFVADGDWKQDPANPESAPDGLGGFNSVIEVKAGATATMPVTTPPVAAPAATAPAGAVTVSFTYADLAATSVSVAGEFNGWSTTANPMQKDAFGIWTTTIPLKPGRHQYKFVVNGTDWKLDPVNPEKVTDSGGNENSVKIVSQ